MAFGLKKYQLHLFRKLFTYGSGTYNKGFNEQQRAQGNHGWNVYLRLFTTVDPVHNKLQASLQPRAIVYCDIKWQKCLYLIVETKQPIDPTLPASAPLTAVDTSCDLRTLSVASAQAHGFSSWFCSFHQTSSTNPTTRGWNASPTIVKLSGNRLQPNEHLQEGSCLLPRWRI